MINDIKREMRSRASLIKGLANVLTEDARYISSDADDFDLISMNESIREAKETLQSLIDHVTELEYTLYLTKQEGP